MSQDYERYAREVGQRIADRLDLLREQNGVSVNWLADFSGLDRGYLSRVLRGRGNPSVRTLALLANALDVPMNSLVKIEEPPRPGPKASPRRRR